MPPFQETSGGGHLPRPSDYLSRTEDEPHAQRKIKILKKYPEIKKLFGPEPLTKYIVFLTVCLQLYIAFTVQDWSWSAFIAVAYVVGGTANHSLFLAIHEMSHNLGSKSLLGNQLIGMMANIPIVIPYSVTFRPYHMAHHRNQGLWGEDTDIPTAIEAYVITKSATCYLDHTLRKALFMFCQIFAYALRPMLMKPETVPNDLWIVMNWMVVGAADVAVFMAADKSFTPLFYLLLSTFFAGSIHPTAGHFIAEHYVFQDKVETYSYYGWLNVLAYNVGYHNEHHDFPNIPWSRLPHVREIAPEFYRNLPECKSWPGTILSFIFDDRISPFSRVTRQRSEVKKNA